MFKKLSPENKNSIIKGVKWFVGGILIGSLLVPIITNFLIFPWYEKNIIGPKLKVYVYDDLDYSGDAPSFIVDIENIGGVSLHNLTTKINYSCQGGGFNIDRKRATGPRILPKKGIMQFSFQEPDLVTEIEKSKIKSSDVLLSLYHVEKIGGNKVKIIEGYLVGFELVWEDNSKLGTHIVQIIDVSKQSHILISNPCKINYYVTSDETSIMGSKEIKVGSMEIDSLMKINDTFNMYIDSNDKWIIIPLTFYDDCGPMNCADLPFQLLKTLHPNITSNAIILTKENVDLIEPKSLKIFYISDFDKKII